MCDMFRWYRVCFDGTADVFPDTPLTRAMVDCDPMQWFGNPEGAIIHGKVIASAFKRKVEKTYDAGHWLKTGELGEPVGEYVTLTITAAREE